MAHPYAVNEKAYNSLIELLVDICKRNNIKQLLWKGDKSLVGKVDEQNMTVHRWFANKACPGDYLYNKHSEIAEEVNKRLGVSLSPLEADLDVLVKNKVINSPDYWKVTAPTVNYLPELIHNMAEKLK